jgi:hypothetical protein
MTIGLYKINELAELEWVHRNTIRNRLHEYVQVDFDQGKRHSTRYLSREDSAKYYKGIALSI